MAQGVAETACSFFCELCGLASLLYNQIAMPAPESVRFPEMAHIRQEFPRPREEEIDRRIRDELEKVSGPISRGQSVALTAGSRNISGIVEILRACVDFLKEGGARPFLVPAMGSHGGASATGQRALLTGFGLTEESMGCPIRSSMDVVQVGEIHGAPLFLDRNASEADWIGVVNRVKPHTMFKGGIESGLMKMLAIGLGKQRGAEAIHHAFRENGCENMVIDTGRELLKQVPVAFGLGIVENAYHEVAEVKCFSAAEFENGDRMLLAKAKDWMGRLPVEDLDLLIVDEQGKNVSGIGMDSNVTGRGHAWWERPFGSPRIRFVVVCDLTEASKGNAMGVGFADFTTQKLVERMDPEVTRINALTACRPEGCRLPAVMSSARDAVAAALWCLGIDRFETARIMRIKNTLELEDLYVSKGLETEIRKNPNLRQITDWNSIRFTEDGDLLPFGE